MCTVYKFINIMVWFGQLLKQYRKIHGLTQVEMTNKIKNMDTILNRLNVIGYFRWEKGVVNPSDYKKYIILSNLGLKWCAYRVCVSRVGKYEMLEDYVIKRYKVPLVTENLYSNERLTYYKEMSTTLSGVVDFMITLSNIHTLSEEDSQYILSYLDKHAHVNHYLLYRDNKTHGVISHLFVSILNVRHIDAVIERSLGESTGTHLLHKVANVDIKSDMLFIFCAFACTLEVFKQQLNHISNMLFEHTYIKKIYIKCYNDDLANIIVKLFDGVVVHRQKQEGYSLWCGIVFDAVQFQLCSVFFKQEPAPCLEGHECRLYNCPFGALK